MGASRLWFSAISLLSRVKGEMSKLFGFLALLECNFDNNKNMPSNFNTYHDIEVVYNCLKNEYGIKQEDVVLYGQSVGGGPTLHLAACSPRFRAVVLHSAILSGIRVLYNVKFTFWFDIFKGTNDYIVDWFHGKRPWELSKEKYDPLWVQGGGHCNLETFLEYIKHLRKFVNAMEKHSFSKRNMAKLSTAPSTTESKHSRCLRFPKR
ncbi:unnamed protein product [Fraxinus pennsylvanica]|uniref:Uncharacterized protein n=1 Tax=Fraxinus pennsylvanica TaxID=56036 RepID=A0AAD2A8X1_9LAMI|nr:unnamed protein product [Fraxinus pennsylvanica]